MLSDSFISIISILNPIISGLILGAIFFYLKENYKKIPNINGKWEFKQLTKTSDYNPYIDMELTYELIIMSQGNIIKGTATKTNEKSKVRNHAYPSKSRKSSQIDGYIERRYFFKPHKVHLHFSEQGGRIFSNYYNLDLIDKKMTGTFISGAGNQSGSIKGEKIV